MAAHHHLQTKRRVKLDLLLDPISHDCVFVNGSCPVTQERVDVVAQRLKIRLLTFLSEWEFNTVYGVPYLQRILGKKIQKEDVDNIFREQILLEPGVAELLSFNSTLTTSTTRVYSLTFKVRCKDATVSLVTINDIGI
jgi:hypothetical protein